MNKVNQFISISFSLSLAFILSACATNSEKPYPESRTEAAEIHRALTQGDISESEAYARIAVVLGNKSASPENEAAVQAARELSQLAKQYEQGRFSRMEYDTRASTFTPRITNYLKNQKAHRANIDRGIIGR